MAMWRWIALAAAIVLICAMAGEIISQPPSQPADQQITQQPEGHLVALWDKWFPDAISVYTLFLVAFTALLAFGGIIQLKFLSRAEMLAAKRPTQRRTRQIRQKTH